MARLARVEDRPTPEEVYNWKVYANSIIATWAAVMIGYDSAFIGTSIALPSFKKEFGLDTKSTAEFNVISANIVSVYQAGCFFGAFLGYLIGYFMGRKYGLLLSSALFLLGAGLQCGASAATGLGIMYAGRIIVGLGIGIASNLAPIYVAEIAPPAIRGRLIGMYEFCWQIGGVIGFWINYSSSLHIPAGHKQWFVAFAIQLIPGGLLFFGSFFLVESPRWLCSRDRNAAALKNLAKIRNLPEDAPYVVEEFAEIEAAIAHERGLAGAGFLGPMKTVFASRTLMYRLLLGSSLFVWQNGTGINAINYYSPTIFKSIGITGTNTSLLTTGKHLVKLLGALVWLLWIIDSFGRRNVLMLGSVGGALAMYYIGAYIAIAKPAQNPTTTLGPGGQSAIAFFYIWTIFYSPSWNGTPWVVGAEMFPQHVRTFTQACQAASNWFWGFIITRFTPQMFTSMGYGVYIFFASLMVISIPYIYFILPETKQIPLERMEELFEPGMKPWNAHGIVMARVHESRLQRKDAQGSPQSTSFEKNQEDRQEAV
ncbi:MFS quinate transporter QutD [Mycena rosella]|uniref:Quinate transporter n=1 Tax=Mycena rosella TaxID=1033263 RepID=A0AAD7H0E7_MYCRO|nr:MFS quinate transporter QutD [Mycena rosella]